MHDSAELLLGCPHGFPQSKSSRLLPNRLRPPSAESSKKSIIESPLRTLNERFGDLAPVDFRGIPGPEGPEVLGTGGTPRFVTLRLKP